MSEIKCPRVWDDVLGKMLYSRFEQFDDSIGFRFSEHLETENPKYMWPTGLHDKNGKEIYEGDILHVYEVSNSSDLEYKSPVEYIDCGFLVTEPNGTQVPFACFSRDGYPLIEIEVIGNIYEHPHLLEKGADHG